MRPERWLRALGVGALLLTTGCVNLAPKYAPPELAVPDAWQEDSPFVEATPDEAALPADWWTLFDDPVLSALETQAIAENADLEVAAERFLQARMDMAQARSRLLPHAGVSLGASANKQSAQALFRSDTSPLRDDNGLGVGLVSWEPDLWGRIRNGIRVGRYTAQQRAADYAAARLSLQAELANAYFTLRRLDAETAIYQQSIAYYERSLAIVQAQSEGKLASNLDVARAEYQLGSTRARLRDIQGAREVAEHAIAVLVNRAPSSFSVAPVDELGVKPLALPGVVPSTLLQRRPDVAAMEREMAAANAEVGIARAGFFPNVSLGLGGGFEGRSALLSGPNSLWGLGVGVDLPVFEGGARRAELRRSWSVWRQTSDAYRGTVLNAFREVEDGLSLTRALSVEVEQQQRAVTAAERQQALSMELYRGGLASSLELINAQVNTLESRIVQVEVKASLLQSSVDLMRAMGGGWSRDALPGDREVSPFAVLAPTAPRVPADVGGVHVNADPAANSDLTAPTALPQ